MSKFTRRVFLHQFDLIGKPALEDEVGISGGLKVGGGGRLYFLLAGVDAVDVLVVTGWWPSWTRGYRHSSSTVAPGGSDPYFT